DLTLVSWGRHLPICNEIADELAAQGQSIEVIDLRSIFPYDWQLIKASVEKTGRLVIVNEDTDLTNFGEHLIYRSVQELFYHLLARPQLIAGKSVPGIGLHANLEDASVPQKHEIIRNIQTTLAEVP
ncbi:MAG TPA: transketolase C-terminal domain-containing protein, partial [Pseudobdellovibrionaceae bacterium]|nr:transketolase C-terminal domain-containing protein [Pseudobdellovibrionaceae bacterium]